MAGISSGAGGHGGKKSVDHEIPLIPFIDLLLCCVMFLLVTAVWNQLARINANQQQPGINTPDAPPPEEKVMLFVKVQSSGYVLASSMGDEIQLPKVGDGYDLEGLRDKLTERKRLEPNRKDIIVAPEDGVAYRDVVAVMDMVVGQGYPDMALRDGSTL
ncbi:MAG: biopolymer transporter ExbD [Myxococcales bacterium]|nr:biopolymer transporter ExbD [Myxococcales bacterium]MCB9708870.1 biopolymer transporter ExbD [Myxococcales bacterium]